MASIEICGIYKRGKAESLLRDSCAQHGSAEVTAFCPFYHLIIVSLEGTGLLPYLLIDGVGWMIHQHCALLIIQLAIHTGVPDQIDDPFLSFVIF